MAEGINQTLVADAVGGSGGSSDDIRRKLILAMLQEGTSGAPVQHWLQGFDRVGKALLGSLQMRDLDQSERAHRLREERWIESQGGAPGGRPAGAGPTSGPRPPGAPTLATAPPMGVDPEPPRAAVGTYPTPKNLGPPAEYGPGLLPGVPGAPSMPPLGTTPGATVDPAMMAAAQAQLQQGAGQQGPFGQNSLPNSQQAPGFAVPPRSDTAMALAAPQQPAGAMPPGMGAQGPSPGMPPAGRPLTPPAPRADQVAQAQPVMTKEQRLEAFRLMRDPRTSAPVRAIISRTLIPKTEVKEIVNPATGEKESYWVNPDTRQVARIEVPTEARDPSSPIPPVPSGVDPKVWIKEHSERLAKGALPATDDQVVKMRNDIRQLPSYQAMAQVAPIYKSMTETAGRNTRASDLNMVYGLAKMLDPIGVVREGDAIMVKSTAAIPDFLVGAVNRLNGGAELQPATRQAIMQEAYSRVKQTHDEYNEDVKFFRGAATAARISPQHVIREFGPFRPWVAPEQRGPRAQGGGNQPVPMTLPPGATPDDLVDMLRRRGLVR